MFSSCLTDNTVCSLHMDRQMNIGEGLIRSSLSESYKKDVNILHESARAKASSLPRLHDHTQAHHARKDSSGQVTSPTLKPLPQTTLTRNKNACIRRNSTQQTQ